MRARDTFRVFAIAAAAAISYPGGVSGNEANAVSASFTFDRAEVGNRLMLWITGGVTAFAADQVGRVGAEVPRSGAEVRRRSGAEVRRRSGAEVRRRSGAEVRRSGAKSAAGCRDGSELAALQRITSVE